MVGITEQSLRFIRKSNFGVNADLAYDELRAQLVFAVAKGANDLRWKSARARGGEVPIPFPTYHFVLNPTSQCPDLTDYANKTSIPFSFWLYFWCKSQSERPNSHFPSAKTGKF